MNAQLTKMKSEWWIRNKTIKYIEQGFDIELAMEMALNEAVKRTYNNNPYNQKRKKNNKYKKRNR